MVSRALWVGCISALALVAAYPAAAQPIETASVVERTCLGTTAEQPATSARRLAAFILSDAGILSDSPEQNLRDILDGNGSTPPQIRLAIRRLADRLQRQLWEGSSETPADVGLQATPRGTSNLTWWLFQPGVRLTCTKFDEASGGGAQTAGGGGDGGSHRSVLDNLRLRQNAEALTATDAARLKAGAAQIGFRRERITADDGTTRHDSTLSIEAALGWAIRDREDSSLLLYAAYEVERLRSNPPPVLAAGASQADKDTNVLELGLTGHQMLRLGRGRIMVAGSGSFITNYVNDSQRLRLNLAATPYFGRFPGGICYFGGFADIGSGPLRGRCTLVFLGQVNHVVDRGTTTPGAADEFVLAGGRVGFDLAMGDASGIIAGVAYEYQRRIHGDVPSIDRFTAQMKYRHWFDARRYAIEMGFDFADGTNPETFVDENRIRFGVGFIF